MLGLFAVALLHFSWTIARITYQLPEILRQVDAFTAALNAAEKTVSYTAKTAVPQMVTEVSAVRKKIPRLFEEIDQTQAMVPQLQQTILQVTEETKAIRSLVPAALERVDRGLATTDRALKEIEQIRPHLPRILDQAEKTRQTADRALDEVEQIRPMIPEILTQVQETRTALPGLLDRVDTLMDKGVQIGSAAGQGAVTGFFKGIVTAPLSLITFTGQSILNQLPGGKNLSEEDIRLIYEAAYKSMETEIPESWKNPKSGNHGSIEIGEEVERDGGVCKEVAVSVYTKKRRKTDTITKWICLKNGEWILIKED